MVGVGVRARVRVRVRIRIRVRVRIFLASTSAFEKVLDKIKVRNLKHSRFQKDSLNTSDSKRFATRQIPKVSQNARFEKILSTRDSKRFSGVDQLCC